MTLNGAARSACADSALATFQFRVLRRLFQGGFERDADVDGQAVRIGFAEPEGVTVAIELVQPFLGVPETDPVGIRDAAVDQFDARAVVAEFLSLIHI